MTDRVRILKLGQALFPATWPARLLLGAVVWTVGLIGVTQWQNLGANPPANRPAVAPAGGLVSSGECRACHPGNYQSWHASFHRTMTQLATPANVIPPLDGLELALDGVVYRVERNASAFFVHQRAASAPVGASAAPREIVLLTGSHHQQNFWLETGHGRALEPFPFGWLIAEEMWAPTGDTFLSPPEEHADRTGAGGAWNSGCIACHTTQGQPRLDGKGGSDSQVVELGIACASCHGEGRDHITRNRNPVRRYLAHLTGAPDPTIANPARMNGPQSALACGQCHSVWAFESASALAAWNRNGASFRPGDAELRDRFVVQPAAADHAAQKSELQAANPHFTENSFWGDGMVRVTGREYNGVQASPCFKGGMFSCLSCHEMHPSGSNRRELATWADGQMKSAAKSDHACLQCHSSIAADLPAHTHHTPQSAGSRCYECHMPRSTFGLLGAVRSHQVSSPGIAESVQLGRPNACNLCHLDQPLAWTAEKLGAWYGQPVGPLSADDREISSGAQWLLRGDAGQRALVAAAMGSPAAQLASGREWLAPYLSITLNDPYAAVRFVAWKSLRTLGGFQNFDFVYTAPDEVTYAAAMRAYQQSVAQWAAQPGKFPDTTLLDSTGRFLPGPYARLLDARDQRRVYLVE